MSAKDIDSTSTRLDAAAWAIRVALYAVRADARLRDLTADTGGASRYVTDDTED